MIAEVFQGREKLWYFRIVADNGEPISQSEAYRRQKDAKDTAKLISRSTFEVIIRSE